MKNLRVLQICKVLNYMLKENPQRFNLKADVEGYFDLRKIVNSVNHYLQFLSTNLNEIKDIINNNLSENFTIKNNKVRVIEVVEEDHDRYTGRPPITLYTIVDNKKLKSIKIDGLSCNQTLFTDIQQFELEEGKTILVVESLKAYMSGINFFKTKDGKFSSENIPFKYINLLETGNEFKYKKELV